MRRKKRQQRIFDNAGNLSALGDGRGNFTPVYDDPNAVPAGVEIVGRNTITGDTYYTDGSVRNMYGVRIVAPGQAPDVSFVDSLRERVGEVATELAETGRKVVDSLTPMMLLGIGIIAVIALKELRPEREMARTAIKERKRK